jgi:hypothetical protein
MTDVTMSQISPPLRILLIGSVLFLVAWFVFLRGGSEDVTPVATTPAVSDPAVPATSGPGKAVEAANGAAAAQTAANAAHGDETQSGGAVAPSTSAAKSGGAATSAAVEKADLSKTGLPASVAKAVAQNKVLVMLFWNPKAADDRAVRREMRFVGRHKGAVAMHIANVKNIARYAPITRGADVEQSPSVVVVGRDMKAALLTGYSDRGVINQAVSDALRAR